MNLQAKSQPFWERSAMDTLLLSELVYIVIRDLRTAQHAMLSMLVEPQAHRHYYPTLTHLYRVDLSTLNAAALKTHWQNLQDKKLESGAQDTLLVLNIDGQLEASVVAHRIQLLINLSDIDSSIGIALCNCNNTDVLIDLFPQLPQNTYTWTDTRPQVYDKLEATPFNILDAFLLHPAFVH